MKDFIVLMIIVLVLLPTIRVKVRIKSKKFLDFGFDLCIKSVSTKITARVLAKLRRLFLTD